MIYKKDMLNDASLLCKVKSVKEICDNFQNELIYKKNESNLNKKNDLKINSNYNSVLNIKRKLENTIHTVNDNLACNQMIYKKDMLNDASLLCKVKSVKEICDNFQNELIYKKNESNLNKKNDLKINSNYNSVLNIKRKLDNTIHTVNDNLVCNQMIYKKDMLNDASLLCKVKSVKEICDHFQNELIYKKNESNLNQKNDLKINSNYNSVLNIKRKLENTIHTVNDNLACNQMIYKKYMLNDASLLCKVKSVKEICDNFQNELIYKKNESNLNTKNDLKINSNYNSVLNIKRKLENTIHTVNENLVCNQMIYKKDILNDASLLCKVKSVKEICDHFQNELIYKKNESNLNQKNDLKINSNYNSVLNIKRKLENTIHTRILSNDILIKELNTLTFIQGVKNNVSRLNTILN